MPKLFTFLELKIMEGTRHIECCTCTYNGTNDNNDNNYYDDEFPPLDPIDPIEPNDTGNSRTEKDVLNTLSQASNNNQK